MVEEDENLDGSQAEDEPPSPRKSSRRQSRSIDKSPEPEFRMPRVDANESLEASWVDESSRSTQFSGNPRGGVRVGDSRRRITQSAVNSGSPEKRSRIHLPTTKASPKLSSRNVSWSDPTDSKVEAFLEVTVRYASTMLQWFFEIFGGALRVLKTPLTYLLAIWLLFGAGVLIRNLVTNSIYASLSPVCRIPGVSLLNLPFCPIHKIDKHGAPPPVEFDELMTVQSKFEEVLEESAGGVSLPMDMKRGEASIRDLRQLVRYSQLHAK